MCRFSSGNWFFYTKFAQLDLEECNKLDLTTAHISEWPGGLLLVVPTYMQFWLRFYWWGCPKKAKLLLIESDTLRSGGDAPSTNAKHKQTSKVQPQFSVTACS
jgi:hypothetical protein